MCVECIKKEKVCCMWWKILSFEETTYFLTLTHFLHLANTNYITHA